MGHFYRRGDNQAGFTLIELVIIIVVLGILAGVAIPRYVNMVDEAREKACLGALGGVRSGISIYYANMALTTGAATWPPMDSLTTVGVVMEHGMPKNPYQSDSNAPDSIVTGVTKGVIVGTLRGELRPNTSVAGENNFSAARGGHPPSSRVRGIP